MKQSFRHVAIVARPRDEDQAIAQTLLTVCACLAQEKIAFCIEDETAKNLEHQGSKQADFSKINEQCDLMIVIGGDGSLLHAARHAVSLDMPVVGINRGYLGFLTDILPEQIEELIPEILAGKYKTEHRFLLQADVIHNNTGCYQTKALNDVVLLPGSAAHMIEFKIIINQKLVSHQRADGLIVATPTGSTAYALSAGGPIIEPHLDAIVLVPMFPHTLSSRPIVVPGDSDICLQISEHNKIDSQLSCDGQKAAIIHPGDTIAIKKYEKTLQLIHPENYDYYQTLRSKLGWEAKHTA